MSLCVCECGFGGEVHRKPGVGSMRVNDKEDITADACLKLSAFAEGLKVPSRELKQRCNWSGRMEV